jgi:DNA-binding response OmpR family regulator
MGKILIVEDDPNIRKLVRVNLVKRGYTVKEAQTATRLWPYSRKNRGPGSAGPVPGPG